jgi:hypothetical protein
MTVHVVVVVEDAVVIAVEVVVEAAPTTIKTSPLRVEANQPLPNPAPILNPRI